MFLHELLLYIFCEICLILDYLQQVTTCYHRFSKESISMYIFYKYHGNVLQVIANILKPY